MAVYQDHVHHASASSSSAFFFFHLHSSSFPEMADLPRLPSNWAFWNLFCPFILSVEDSSKSSKKVGQVPALCVASWVGGCIAGCLAILLVVVLLAGLELSFHKMYWLKIQGEDSKFPQFRQLRTVRPVKSLG